MPMRYYTTAILTYEDESKNKRSTYDYATVDEAVARFHSMFGYMTTEGVTSVMAICYNSQGGVIRSEYWEKKTEEPTEEATEAVSR
jgi:hypothetical protein